MSFRFTVLSDERFVEILEAWADSPWPKAEEVGYALRDRFGWVPDGIDPALFTSDVEPDEPSAYFTARNGMIKMLNLPLTDIAPEEAWGYSMEQALEVYRHFCEILTRRYGKPKRRKNKDGCYRATFVTPQGVGVKVGGNDALVRCIVESPEEMSIAGEYERLVAKGYIVEDE